MQDLNPDSMGNVTSATPDLGAAAASAATPSPVSGTSLSTKSANFVTPWPRSAQLALALIILLTIGLLSWTAYGRSRWAVRPIALNADNGDIFRVDLNRADRTQLLQLPGAGDSTVSHIEAYRREHGGFHDVEELTQISGIGPALVERWRTLVYVSPMDAADGDGDGNDAPAMPARPIVRGARPDPEAKAMRGSGGKQALKPGESIDINKASQAELQRIPGVGPIMATHIVDARTRKAFTSIEDLLRVTGIKQRTFEKLRPYVRVE